MHLRLTVHFPQRVTFKTEVKGDQFLLLGPAGSIRLPNFAMPPLMNNHCNYIVSLRLVCRWLAEKAETLGAEICPGFAATAVLYNEQGAVIGVATSDMGVKKNGEPGPNFARGMELLGKYTLIGESVRGSWLPSASSCARRLKHNQPPLWLTAQDQDARPNWK